MSYYANRSLAYFYSKDMYTYCAKLTLRKTDATLYFTCKNFIAIGGIVGLLTIPTVTIGIFGNSILFVGLVTRIRRSNRQEMYGAAFAVIDSFNLVYLGFVINFFSKGLPWIANSGYYLEYNSPMFCKFSSFFRLLIIAVSVNTLFCESVGRMLCIKSQGAHSAKFQYVMFALIVAMATSLLHASPVLLTHNLVRPDGQYQCNADSYWPQHFIYWAAIHQLLLCDGLVQNLIVMGCNCYTLYGQLRLRATIEFIEGSIKESNLVSDAMRQLARLLHNVERDTQVALLHSSLLSFILIVRASAKFQLYTVLYINFEDNNSIEGVMDNYRWSAITDIIEFLYLLFISCHLWVYYFFIPPFRIWIRDCVKFISCGSPAVIRVVDMFMLADNELGESPEQWQRSQAFLQTLDPILYERLTQLSNALHKNVSDIDENYIMT